MVSRNKLWIVICGMVGSTLLSTHIQAQNADVKNEVPEAQSPAQSASSPDSALIKEESLSIAGTSGATAQDTEAQPKSQNKTETNQVALPEKKSLWSGISSGLIWFGAAFIVLLAAIFMFT